MCPLAENARITSMIIKCSRALLMPQPVIDEPFKRITIDSVGLLQRTNRGNKFVLTMMDFPPHNQEAIPLKKIDAEIVAEALNQIFSRMRLPKRDTFGPRLQLHVYPDEVCF